MRASSLGLESLAFQSTAFYDDLTQSLEFLRTFEPVPPSRTYFDRAEVQALLHTIRAFTGLQVIFNPEAGNELFMLNPTYTGQHIFLSRDYHGHVAQISAPALAQMIKEPLYHGTIDLTAGRVTGDFCKITNVLSAPQSLLQSGQLYGQSFTPRETAALLLHEVGHAFTALEYMNRTVTTNQMLSATTQALLKLSPDEISIVLDTIDIRLNLTPVQKNALRKARDKENAAVVLTSVMVEKCRSELGDSVFDYTSCEHLADQFAGRFGATKELILALDRISTHNSAATYHRRVAVDAFIFGFFGTLLLPVTLGALLALSWARDAGDLFGIHATPYGSFHTRISRLKQDLLQRLKDLSLGALEKQQTLDALKEAERVLELESNQLTFYEGLMYCINSTVRSDYKFEVLQKQLESYTNNGLFGHAAKLSTLTA